MRNFSCNYSGMTITSIAQYAVGTMYETTIYRFCIYWQTKFCSLCETTFDYKPLYIVVLPNYHPLFRAWIVTFSLSWAIARVIHCRKCKPLCSASVNPKRISGFTGYCLFYAPLWRCGMNCRHAHCLIYPSNSRAKVSFFTMGRSVRFYVRLIQSSNACITVAKRTRTPSKIIYSSIRIVECSSWRPPLKAKGMIRNSPIKPTTACLRAVVWAKIAVFKAFHLKGLPFCNPRKSQKAKRFPISIKPSINQWQASLRIRIEHAIVGVQRLRIVKDKLRNWKAGFRDSIMELCCGLHNFRLKFRPWHYGLLQLHLFVDF